MSRYSDKTYDRKFDDWKWQDTTIHPAEHTFEVRIRRPENIAEGKFDYYVKLSDTIRADMKSRFTATQPAGFPVLELSAHDVAKLRDKIVAWLAEWYVVEWTPIIRIRFDAKVHAEEDDNSVAMQFEYNFYEQAKFADGLLVHREVPEDKKRSKKSEERPAREYGLFRLRDGTIQAVDGRQFTYHTKGAPEETERIAYIDDTPQNRAALAAIRKGFVDLGTKLDGLLKQDAIEKTLASVQFNKLLGA